MSTMIDRLVLIFSVNRGASNTISVFKLWALLEKQVSEKKIITMAMLINLKNVEGTQNEEEKEEEEDMLSFEDWKDYVKELRDF